MAKTQKAAAPVEIIAAPLPEEGLVHADSLTIVGFLNGLVPFFLGAQQLEAKARERLALSKLLKLPAPGDVDGDAQLQTFIKEGSAEKKAVEKHWEITALVHGFHKKLTAARGRATLMLEEATATAQRHHNTFIEDAKRRAQMEQDRIDREAREKAEADRKRELAALEAKALENEQASEDLSVREDQFAGLVATGYKPVDVARVAGYKNFAEQAEKLLALPKIIAAIDGKKAAAQIRRQATAVAETPLNVQTETVKAEVTKVGTDRSSHTAEVLNEQALIEAVIRGGLGIPTDVLMVNPVKLNEYARSMHELINRWPGVRYVKKTTTV